MPCNGIQQCGYCHKSMYCSDRDLISAYKLLIEALEGLCETRRNRGDGTKSAGNIHHWLASVRDCKSKVKTLER